MVAFNDKTKDRTLSVIVAASHSLESISTDFTQSSADKPGTESFDDERDVDDDFDDDFDAECIIDRFTAEPPIAVT